MPSPSWYRYDPERDVLTLALRAQPGARRTELGGVHGGALKIRLAAPAIEGRANALLIDFLRKSFRLPASRVVLTRGERGRSKTVEIASPGAAVLALVREWEQQA